MRSQTKCDECKKTVKEYYKIPDGDGYIELCKKCLDRTKVVPKIARTKGDPVVELG